MGLYREGENLLLYEARILHSFLLQLELTADIPVKKLNSKGICFLFKFVWLKSLVTKQKLRTKFATFVVKLRNMILPSIFKSMFYSF